MDLQIKNLISAFRTTGIAPLDRKEVLKKLPDTENTGTGGENREDNINDSVVEYLKKNKNTRQS